MIYEHLPFWFRPGNGYAWCARRDAETNSSCYVRTLIVREFIKYLCDRGMTGIVVPKPPKLKKRQYIPHAFTEKELARFLETCDSIAPYKRRPASVLLNSSGFLLYSQLRQSKALA